jgi:transcriptional regulator with XRE-family HTH domain
MARKSPKVGMDWLTARMEELGISSLEDAAQRCDLNRGTLYRYFSLEMKPSVAVLPQLCEGLDASPMEILQALDVQISNQ